MDLTTSVASPAAAPVASDAVNPWRFCVAPMMDWCYSAIS